MKCRDATHCVCGTDAHRSPSSVSSIVNFTAPDNDNRDFPVRILLIVPELRDKRRRSDLDVFVLALVNGGVSTPYELKTAAGLSPGATIPALARLMKARFIRQGKSGPRGRIDHKITAEGRRHLKQGWKYLI